MYNGTKHSSRLQSKTLNIPGGGMNKGAKHYFTSCSRPALACSSRLQSKNLNIPGGKMYEGTKPRLDRKELGEKERQVPLSS